MRNVIVLALTVVLLAAPAYAIRIPQEQLLVQGTSGGKITVDRLLTRPRSPELAKEIDAYNRGDGEGADIHVDYPFNVKLSEKDTLYFYVLCDAGFSGDPRCRLKDTRCPTPRSDNVECPLTMVGEDLTIPGDGCVYDSRNANDYFNRRERVCLVDGKFVKTPQPFYYVGLKTITQVAIQLFTDEKLTQPLSKIGAYEEVEVVLTSYVSAASDSSVYLLRDAYGIVGWAKVKPVGQDDTGDIKGLLFHGD